MHPNEPTKEIEAEEVESHIAVAEDVIGNSAYSESFVLNIFIKLASKDILQDDLEQESLEEDLYTLWDMTAERELVMYLKSQGVLDLLTFAMPVIKSPHIIEIMIGIIGNMCCLKDVAEVVAANNDLLVILFKHLKSDDIGILNELLQLISSCMKLAEEEDVGVWMSKFDESGYANILYSILKNSTNKDLLLTALENLDNIGMQCNIEEYTADFIRMFVCTDAIDTLYVGFKELNKYLSDEDDKTGIYMITLQIITQLVRFIKPLEVFSLNRESAVYILQDIFGYYEHNVTELSPKMHRYLVYILETADPIVDVLRLSEISNLDKYFNPCYKMWKDAFSVPCDNVEENWREGEIKRFVKRLRHAVSMLMYTFMSQCSEENLVKALDTISDNYDNITNDVSNVNLKDKIVKRTARYRST